MTTRDIRAHLREMYDVKVPADLISRVTDAAAALDAFTAALQPRYLAIVRLWRAHWAEFTPFLAFRPRSAMRSTRRTRESMNPRLRKVTRNRGQFPSGQAALKVLYLAVRNLEEFRGRNVGIRSSGCHHQSRD
jgi:transposase-like protein